MTTLLREELVELSALALLNSDLPTYGFVLSGGGQDVRLREAFPTPEERAQELEMTTVAFGFNIDDGGKLIEMGSDLTEYVHTLIVWTFATEPRFGRKLAHAIKHVFRAGQAEIPLLDFGQEGNPQIDSLRVDKAQVRHEVNQSPRPWDQYVWTTTITLTDYFVP
jgi:hypothetical protein